MKILQINKFFYPHGGGARYFLEVSQMLDDYKHEIAYFAMDDKRNQKTQWSKYFVSNATLEQQSLSSVFKIFVRMIYSIEVKNKISELLDDYKIDVVHLHGIAHQLSPSLILKLKKRNIPIVQTVHEYHLISPTYNMFHNGKICEITKPNRFYKAILHKCVKDSYFYTLAEVIEKYFHYFTGWERNYIDYFIAPSVFMKNKLIEYGIDEEKVIHLPYFIDYHKYKPAYDSGSYILYFGRLAPEKGLSFLLDVMHKIPNIKLKIVGRGQEENSLKLKVKSEKLANVEFLGFKDGEELKRLITDSRFTILPSLWYDVAPISILESFASGKPVVASNIGGIPETVKDGFNGFLFEPGNVDDCVEKINKLWNNEVLARKLGRNAREYVEKNFGPEEHYEKLMGIYRRAIAKYR